MVVLAMAAFQVRLGEGSNNAWDGSQELYLKAT